MTEPTLSSHLDSILSDPATRRRYAQNSLIVDTAVALNKALEAADVNQRELAQRLGRSEGFVSQVLSGGGNLTLRTLADFAYGLDCTIDLALRPLDVASCVFASKLRTVWTPSTIEPRREIVAANTQLALAA